MPQPSKIPLAFAASGDKNVIPESTETTGLASWRDGFPAITSTPFSEGGIAPKRADFNGIFNALSLATIWQQQGGFYGYDATTDYEAGNIVIYSGEIYVCKTANGPASALHSPANDTAETYWGRIYPQNGTFDRMFFSQTSGSYTAPRTGVYRITLKGGGGGGAYRNPNSGCGGGGGEGGTLIFYATLTKNTAYAYTVGAGGSAGDYNDGTPISNTSGGATTFKIGNATYSAGGGGYAWPGGNNPLGGLGGATFSAPSDSIQIHGSPGESGQWGTVTKAGGSGGGAGGGAGAQNNTDLRINGVLGGGGAGQGTINSTNLCSGAGGDGYILIEYAG